MRWMIRNPNDREFNRIADEIMENGLILCILVLALLAILLPTWSLWIDEPFIRWPLVGLFAALAGISGRWLWIIMSYSPEKIKNQTQKRSFRTDSKVR